MESENMFVITSFSLRTADEKDYKAYTEIPNITTKDFKFMEFFIDNTGYNPGSAKGNKQECKVCGKSGSECIGHPLVMNLKPFECKFVSEFGEKTLKYITNSICSVCKKIVHEKDTQDKKKRNDVDYSPKKKLTLKELSALPLSKKACDCVSPKICELKQEKVEGAETKQKYASRDTKPKNMTFNITDIYNLLMEETIDFTPFGFEKKNITNLFFDKLFLLPAANQQMAFKSGNDSGVDEITGYMKLYHDMWYNMNSSGNPNYPSTGYSFREIVTKIFIGEGDNKYPGTPSYLKTMNGKEGLYRNDALNKRVIGTGRAVITLGTKRAGQLQIPEYIQKNLHYKIEVMDHNIEELQKKVGINVTHLITEIEASTTNKRKTYMKLNPDFRLKRGDMVLKNIEDGDPVIFSRHPVLWMHSEIGYDCFVWKNKCIGIPETSAPGHNADFDGDEGNIYVGANLESRIEMSMNSARFNLMGAHSGTPVIGITYNGIVGAYVCSVDDDINPKLFDQLTMTIEGKMMETNSSPADNYLRNIKIDFDYYKRKAKEHNLKYYSGKILFSMLLPKTLNYKRGDVEIKNGIMLSGALKKVDVNNKLITAIAAIDPYRSPYLFVDRGYAMLSEYISAKGITISGRDYIMPGELRKQVEPENWNEMLEDLDRRVQEMENIKTKLTKASKENMEQKINNEIAQVIKKVNDLFEKGEYGSTGIAKISYKSGARGNIPNIVSAVTCVGQQHTGANRLGLNEPRLTLYSTYGSKSIFDKGFVRNSFSNGLSPHEVCMMASPARISAFTVYLGTPESGNASRQSACGLGGIYVDDSLSLVDRRGHILDPLYGAGSNPTKTRNQETKCGTANSCVNIVEILNSHPNIA